MGLLNVSYGKSTRSNGLIDAALKGVKISSISRNFMIIIN